VCLSTSHVFLLDALVERVAVAPESLPRWIGTDTGSVATMASLGIVASRTSERDLRGAGPPIDRLAVCFVLTMFSSLPRPLTGEVPSSWKRNLEHQVQRSTY
jgi:hypothetical protein